RRVDRFELGDHPIALGAGVVEPSALGGKIGEGFRRHRGRDRIGPIRRRPMRKLARMDVALIDSTDTATDVATVAADSAEADLLDELLIEEISIDGMCGVY